MMHPKLNKLLMGVLLCTFVFGGCATGYVSKSKVRNGYANQTLAEGSYVVTFQANESTPRDEVKAYALRRAAEVTLQNGYRYFEIQKTVEPHRMGKAEEGIRYPSVRLYIHCSMERGSSQAYSAEDLVR